MLTMLKDGAIGYLRKPLDENHLGRCLHAALHSRERPGDVWLRLRARQGKL